MEIGIVRLELNWRKSVPRTQSRVKVVTLINYFCRQCPRPTEKYVFPSVLRGVQYLFVSIEVLRPTEVVPVGSIFSFRSRETSKRYDRDGGSHPRRRSVTRTIDGDNSWSTHVQSYMSVVHSESCWNTLPIVTVVKCLFLWFRVLSGRRMNHSMSTIRVFDLTFDSRQGKFHVLVMFYTGDGLLSKVLVSDGVVSRFPT